jgi:hypothetical protein
MQPLTQRAPTQIAVINWKLIMNARPVMLGSVPTILTLLVILVSQNADLLLALRVADTDDCGASCCDTARAGGAASQACCETKCAHPTNFAIEKSPDTGVLVSAAFVCFSGATFPLAGDAPHAAPDPGSAAPIYLRIKSLLI